MEAMLPGVQMALVLSLAPLLAGCIKTCKARLQNRRGPGIGQSYADLFKWLGKDEVLSPTVSWIFRLAPYFYFAAALAGAALLPLGSGLAGDMFVLLYILAQGRFWLVLASLDAGSSFGGMGGSREMFISVLVEPVLLLALLTLALPAETTSLPRLAAFAAEQSLSPAYLFAATAFFMVLLAETGRIPIDNPDTHLELTMIHEGMVLEYSGRRLALIMWAAAVKQLLLILWFVLLFWPNPAASSGWQNVVFLAGKTLTVALAVAWVETSTNKMRLFKVPGFLAVAALLAVLALVAQ